MKKGFTGQVMGIFALIIWLGLALAILKRFDWDIGEAIAWIGDLFIRAVSAVANWISGLASFNKVVGS